MSEACGWKPIQSRCASTSLTILPRRRPRRYPPVGDASRKPRLLTLSTTMTIRHCGLLKWINPRLSNLRVPGCQRSLLHRPPAGEQPASICEKTGEHRCTAVDSTIRSQHRRARKACLCIFHRKLRTSSSTTSSHSTRPGTCWPLNTIRIWVRRCHSARSNSTSCGSSWAATSTYPDYVFDGKHSNVVDYLANRSWRVIVRLGWDLLTDCGRIFSDDDEMTRFRNVVRVACNAEIGTEDRR